MYKHQVLIKFWQKWSKHDVQWYIQRSIRNNNKKKRYRKGKGQLLHLLIKRVLHKFLLPLLFVCLLSYAYNNRCYYCIYTCMLTASWCVFVLIVYCVFVFRQWMLHLHLNIELWSISYSVPYLVDDGSMKHECICISLQRKPKAECGFQINMTAWDLLHPQGSDLRRGEGIGQKCGKKALKCLNPRLPAYHIHKQMQFQWADLLWILKLRQGFIRSQNKGTLLFTHVYLIALDGSFAWRWL